MEHRLEQSHELRLEFRLSPQLLETLKILQMPKLDLKQFIQTKIEENPFIERDEEPDETEISFEEELEEELFSYPISFSVESTPLEDREMLIGAEKTLKEHLKEQLHISAKSQKEIEIGEFIIDSLDDDGFLKISLKEIADKFGVKPEEVDAIRKKIQMFEPVGTASFDEKECILTQLKARGFKSEEALKVLNEFFEELHEKKFHKILKKVKNIDIEFLENLSKTIEILNPHPGRVWSKVNDYISPDIIIKKVGNEWIPIINDEFLPKIKLNNVYRELLENPKRFSKRDKEFLEQKYNEAKAILMGIEKRRETLLAIARYIIDKEKEFFEKGKKYFKCLTLEEVAREIGRDPSTVSRACKGKYIQTPVGIFELSDFFGSGKFRDWAAISNRIKELIEKEDKEQPLTDEEIARILRREGYNIARTTVVKYRKMLGIPGSRERKRK